MKRVLAVLAVLFASVSAFAQLGYYSAAAPGQNQIWQGGVYWVCATATATATCKASADVTIYSDAAGASPISQTSAGVAIGISGQVTFYAQPGTYKLVFLYTNPNIGTFTKIFNVVPNVAGNIALADGYFAVPAPGNCFEAASTNAGSGDGTVLIDGAVPALKGILSASGAANLVFTCQIPLPSRITSGKGAIIQDISFNYAVQTNSLDSWAATLKSFTGPESGASQTPASATLATFGGTLTLSSFTGNGAASAAGSYYTQKITLGTPVAVADRQVLVLQLTGAHAAASAITVTVPTILVHYKINNL